MCSKSPDMGVTSPFALTPFGAFNSTEGSHLSTRPASPFGTAITPGNNTYGTAVQIGADLTFDAYAILIGVNAIAVAAAAKDSLTQIGFDFAGGTTFPASPNAYDSITLLTSCATNYASGQGGGVQFLFPLFIPAGTAILARGSVNNATVGTQNVWWKTWGRPSHPESIRVGRWVESLGIVAASSRGTTVTPGTTAEGASVSLGTLTNPCWYFEYGFGVNDATMNSRTFHVDLQAGSGGPLILEDALVHTSSSEQILKQPAASYVPIVDVPAGTAIHGRAQCDGTLDAAYSMAAYAVGG